MKTRTLEERIRDRNDKTKVMLYEDDHVRAELQRVARAARKGIASGKIVSPAQVIALLKEAQR